ncbi:MAG TPA: DUF4126 domain-containing protein [Terriglobales bacterium]|nr:DUF4126 domain-containing protein [Terriglobales bacterium]
MSFGGAEVVGILAGASFAAGLNVYATVATLGLMARAGVLELPASLHLIDNWWTIGAAFALFALEFVADKIPAFDLIWNALQTFVRVPIAALLAYGAAAQLPPWQQATAAALGGGIGLAAHGGKIAARAAVTPSPEPFSNMGLSLVEDVVAILLTWFAATHPYITAAIVAVLLLLIVLAIRFVLRAMKRLYRGAVRLVEQRA